MALPRLRARRLVVPERLLSRVRAHVVDDHPAEAGGYLVCERSGDSLRAVDAVRLANDAARPRWRFETAVEAAPDAPRVFYHSHTTPASPSGLTKPDRQIPERYLMVVFAPQGELGSYRLFRRGVFNWVELRAEVERGQDRHRLPRLV